ncbi:MAG TPA: NupC/NupG family nucleoside CNT transporter [Vicinamibacteria bacterium]|jgi:CNT family concentrative nucleoside transporter|nr:NupC/NupG family nucleoside CNT transporter [Vicinamibacteria bacterium]
MERLLPLVGLAVIMGIAYACSTDRSAVKAKTVLWGLGLQFALALFVLKTEVGRALFSALSDKIKTLLSFSYAGSKMVFGALGAPGGQGEAGPSFGFIFAFQVLPTIIFVAALFAVLYHLGVMQVIVKLFATVMTRLLGASGAESLNVAASIFMGQTEAPLTVRPFLNGMTQSELMCVMTSGMAHISGGIMAAYIALGIEPKHLLAAVIMTAPGTILLSKLFVPETEIPQTAGTVRLEIPKTDANIVGAAARGTSDGLSLALNVAAMLVSFLALVALLNAILGWLSLHTLGHAVTLETLLGYAFAPLALLMGVPAQDTRIVGSLLGTRMVTNEFIAYSQLGPLKATLDPKSFVIATYALCGFANFGSIGIQIGGIGALAPERRHDLARLGLRALLAGTFANFMTACIAGMLL